MADDIVTRLRDMTVMGWEGDEVTEPLCKEAADEIERLREQVEYLHNNISMLREEARRG